MNVDAHRRVWLDVVNQLDDTLKEAREEKADGGPEYSLLLVLAIFSAHMAMAYSREEKRENESGK